MKRSELTCNECCCRFGGLLDCETECPRNPDNPIPGDLVCTMTDLRFKTNGDPVDNIRAYIDRRAITDTLTRRALQREPLE